MPRKHVTSVESVPFLCSDIRDVAKLIRRLRKHLPPDHPDHDTALEALRKLRHIQDGVEQLRYNACH